jgi:hypothetical protein
MKFPNAITMFIDIATPAEELAEAREQYHKLVTEKDRLIEKAATLKREEEQMLAGASLEDPQTFRAVSDIRLAQEIVARKLKEIDGLRPAAARALSDAIGQFNSAGKLLIATGKGQLGKQSAAIQAEALRPYECAIDKYHNSLRQFGAVIADNDYRETDERRLLTNSERLLAAAAAAQLPPSTPINETQS